MLVHTALNRCPAFLSYKHNINVIMNWDEIKIFLLIIANVDCLLKGIALLI